MLRVSIDDAMTNNSHDAKTTRGSFPRCSNMAFTLEIEMKKAIFLAIIISATSFATPSMARDSGRDSGTSIAAVSVAPASIAVVSAYVGSEMVIESVRAVGEVFEVVLKGVGAASRAVLTLTADSVKATSLVAGQSVKVVAEGSGYLLVASGKALCFVPGETDQSLLRSSRSQ